MEFILIDESRLKVMLNKSDLDEFDLRAEELDYSNTETKRMFWDIIGRAKKSVGFTCDGMRVLVQLYSSRDGGCEMFISKLGISRDAKNGESEASLRFKTLHKNDPSSSRLGAFSFDNVEWLIAVCKRLSDIGYSEESSAYVDDCHRYYLFLDGLDGSGYFTVDEYSFITEYGFAENARDAMGLLCERGRVICKENAVKILSAL